MVNLAERDRKAAEEALGCFEFTQPGRLMTFPEVRAAFDAAARMMPTRECPPESFFAWKPEGGFLVKEGYREVEGDDAFRYYKAWAEVEDGVVAGLVVCDHDHTELGFYCPRGPSLR